MIKIISPALRNPAAGRSLDEFHRYWAESHGPLFSQTTRLRRYVQHLTLPEAYGAEPKPTHDGASMFWFDEPDDLVASASVSPEAKALRQAVLADDRQLFDRLPGWPLHHKRASVTAVEDVIVAGATEPSMVKALFIVARMPGLTHQEFFDHWRHVHGELVAAVPGLRRYAQNHAILETFASTMRGTTHDGWSELWFDDLAALQAAVASPAWRKVREDGATLFAEPKAIVVARERIQKEIDVSLKEPEAASMSDEAIRARLAEQGYAALAADPEAPRRIKAAAERGMLAVWTAEHIVTIDESHIDARPER